MVDYTPTWNLPYPAAGDSVRPESRDFAALAVAAASALTDVDGATAKAGTLASSTDLNTVTTPGVYGIRAANPNGTGTSGIMIVGRIDDLVVQFAHNYVSPVIHKRSRGTGDWREWEQVAGPLVRPRATEEDITDLNSLVEEGTWSLWVADSVANRPVLDVNAIVDVTWYRGEAWVQTWRTIQDDYSVWQRRTLNAGITWSEWERIASTRFTGVIPFMYQDTDITDLDEMVMDGVWTVRQTDGFANRPDSGNAAVLEVRLYRPNAWVQTWQTIMNGDYVIWKRHTINNGDSWYPWTKVTGTDSGGGGGDTLESWSPQDSVYFWGDSSVKGGDGTDPEWPTGFALWERLNSVLAVPVENRAVGGFTAANVLMRAGIMRINARPVGGSIPASGSVFVILEEAFPTSQTFGMDCTWAGVAGSLRRQSADGQWRFDRSTPGAAVTVSNNTQIIPNWSINPWRGTHIFMMAGNDWTWINDYTGPDHGNAADHAVAAYLRAVNAVQPTGERHVLIAGVKSRQATTIGSLNHSWVQEINGRLAQEAPGHFVSRQDWLVHNSLRVQGLTPNSEDEDRIAAGLIPARAFADVTHIKREVCEAEAKELWMPELARRGWSQPNAAGQTLLDGMTFTPRPYVPA